MGQSSRRQLCWYNPQAWYRKLLFITVHLLVVIPICKMFGSFRFFQHHHSKCRINLFLPLLFVSLPICIWVDMPPKREKSRKKWQNIFLKLYFAWCSWQNDASSCFSFSRTRVRARLPTAMLIFCCHKCHTRENLEGKPEQILEGRRERETTFDSRYRCVFRLWTLCLLKSVENRRRVLVYSALQIVLWHLWQQKCKNSCDVRVRVRAREGCYRCFHNSNAMFPISVSRIGVFALSTFHWKQHVVFTKTTRRFH